MKQKYMKIAINEALKAFKEDEVPIGCIIIYNNKIIAKSHNTREKHNCVLDHAEINTIKKASKKLKTWKLNECELYVTLKPCTMCENVIKHARIKKVYYLLDKLAFKKEYNNTEYEKMDFPNDYGKILTKFFENKRKK